MRAVFIGRGIGQDRRVPAAPTGQQFIPRKDEGVRLNGNLYWVTDVHWDYDAMEIRVYLRLH